MSPPAFVSDATAWIQPSLKHVATTTRANTRLFSSARSHSHRGIDAVKLLPSYLVDARAVERYDAETCPHGALQLSVAENQMLEDLLVPALTDFACQEDFAADLIYYQPTQGRPGLRNAFCSYLERLLSLSSPLNPEHLVVGAGCNAVLENLCICLANQGDAVLIPTPYYAAFEFDLQARANLKIVPVNTMQQEYAGDIPVEAYYPSKAGLDKAYQQAHDAGTPPKILLLSHPNNPLGICYPPEVVQECIEWCRDNKVHLVSDEIYAGSVYTDGVFASALELAQQDLGDYVHFVYALSKDFGLSGLRVGAVYTENEHIQLPLQKLNDLCQISSQTQTTVERMLSSKDVNGEFWTDSFLKENCSRIQARCNQLQTCLEDCDIPYIKADSGLFVWMDFSEFLPPLDPARVQSDGKEELDSMEERERILYLELMKEYGLLFTPGMSMRNELPGFFRCVFTAANDDEFALGLERIRAFVNAKR